jgi:hypothetical protein
MAVAAILQKERAMQLLGLLALLLVNAIPLVGVHWHGWSANTVILLYWCENALTVVFTCARIALHRRLTRKRGHWRGGVLGLHAYDKPQTQSRLLGEFAWRTGPIVLLWGMIFATMSLVFADRFNGELSPQQVLQGAVWMSAATTLDFLVDSATLRTRSFAWIKAYAGLRLGKVMVLQMLLYAGWLGGMLTRSPWGFFYTLIGLKTVWDLTAYFAAGKSAARQATALRWMFGWISGDRADEDPDEMFLVVKVDEEVMPG